MSKVTQQVRGGDASAPPCRAGPARAPAEPALLCASQRDWTAGVGRSAGGGSWQLALDQAPFPALPSARSLRVLEPQGAVARVGPWEALAVALAPSPSHQPSVLPPRWLFLPWSRPWRGGGGGQRVARAPVGRAGSDGGWSCMSQAKREAPLSGGGCEEGLQAGSLGGRRRWRWGWRRQEASLPPGLGCPGHRALGGCLHVTPPKPLVVFTPPHVSRMTSRAAFMMTVLLSLSLGPKRLGLAMNEASGQLL